MDDMRGREPAEPGEDRIWQIFYSICGPVSKVAKENGITTLQAFQIGVQGAQLLENTQPPHARTQSPMSSTPSQQQGLPGRGVPQPSGMSMGRHSTSALAHPMDGKRRMLHSPQVVWVWQLHHNHRLTYEEIAKQMGLDARVVKNICERKTFKNVTCNLQKERPTDAPLVTGQPPPPPGLPNAPT